MKAIILAAGTGSRLNKYTRSLPKGMLPFAGKPLLAWQIEAFRRAGISEIVVVTGYRAEAITFDRVIFRHNPLYASTNMVESLMTASDLFDDELLISYADLLVDNDLLATTVGFQGDVGVVVDEDWQKYWLARYGKIDFDTESLQLDGKGCIRELGIPDTPAAQIDGRYVGMLRFSRQGIKELVRVYELEKAAYNGGTWRNSKSFENGYLTDLLQAMIDHGQKVQAISCEGGWLEFDTVGDYETYQEWAAQGTLGRFLKWPAR